MTQKASKEQHKTSHILCIDCQENIQECLQGKFCQRCSQSLETPLSKVDSSTLINNEEKDILNEKNDEIEDQNELGIKRSRPIQEKTKTSNQCGTCNKKVGILGYKCNHCSINYCKNHRLPENHQCQVDFISLGRKKLKLQNPIVRSSKIQQI